MGNYLPSRPKQQQDLLKEGCMNPPEDDADAPLPLEKFYIPGADVRYDTYEEDLQEGLLRPRPVRNYCGPRTIMIKNMAKFVCFIATLQIILIVAVILITLKISH